MDFRYQIIKAVGHMYPGGQAVINELQPNDDRKYTKHLC